MNRVKVIIVNDYSTDDTMDYLKRLKHPNVEVITAPERQGTPAKVRNLAFNMVKTKYVTFLDADDEYFGRTIDYMLYLIEKQNLDMIKANNLVELPTHIDRYTLCTKTEIFEGENIKNSPKFTRNLTFLWNNIIKTSFLEGKKLDDGIGEDLLFNLQISRELKKAAVYNADIIVYDKTSESYSSGKISQKKLEATLNIMEKAYKISPNKEDFVENFILGNIINVYNILDFDEKIIEKVVKLARLKQKNETAVNVLKKYYYSLDVIGVKNIELRNNELKIEFVRTLKNQLYNQIYLKEQLLPVDNEFIQTYKKTENFLYLMDENDQMLNIKYFILRQFASIKNNELYAVRNVNGYISCTTCTRRKNLINLSLIRKNNRVFLKVKYNYIIQEDLYINGIKLSNNMELSIDLFDEFIITDIDGNIIDADICSRSISYRGFENRKLTRLDKKYIIRKYINENIKVKDVQVAEDKINIEFENNDIIGEYKFNDEKINNLNDQENLIKFENKKYSLKLNGKKLNFNYFKPYMLITKNKIVVIYWQKNYINVRVQEKKDKNIVYVQFLTDALTIYYYDSEKIKSMDITYGKYENKLNLNASEKYKWKRKQNIFKLSLRKNYIMYKYSKNYTRIFLSKIKRSLVKISI